VEDSNALLALKYMLMSKIMLNLPDEVRPKFLFIGYESTLRTIIFHEPVFRIRIHLIRIRVQHFKLNTDPDPGF
jgi:hypothetical protein